MIMPKKENSELIYQMKITLKDVDPSVWRRLQVNGQINLKKLHEVFQIAMGWTNTHLHQFLIGSFWYSVPDEEEDHESLDERKFKLDSLGLEVNQEFEYQYDFGDGWEHVILIEEIFGKDDLHSDVPVCLAGERACPPEDCGGPFGYEDFLKIIQDPVHSEHESMLEWAGGSFDPEAFSLEETNAALKKIRAGSSKKDESIPC